MPKCEVCGKGPKVGNNVSHSNNHTKRRFEPNLQRQLVVIEGKKVRAKVCTRCIRSGRAVRPVVSA